MDRRQMIVQRARELVGNRLDEVIQSVHRDREELRGWQEPSHLRAALRRAIREEGGENAEEASIALAEAEIGRGAGEPDKGQQREALGRILEAAGAALDKVRGNRNAEVTADESFGLECALLLYARPGVLVGRREFADVPTFWNVLEKHRDDIELTQRGVGRIELIGHPDYDWAGTGVLVGETCLMTTRTVAQVFAERSERGDWAFRPGISAWMDYEGERHGPSSAAHRVKGILGVHDRYDLAILEVEPPQNGAAAPVALASEPPAHLEGRLAYLIGYPVRDGRRNDPEGIARVFRDHYDVKRLQPGTLRKIVTFGDVQILQHDCAPLGHSAGGCLVDVETHRVLGLHVSGRYLENGSAIPMWALKDDPLLQRCRVTYAKANAQELGSVADQVERLARTRFWQETRSAIGSLYEQAFGKQDDGSIR